MLCRKKSRPRDHGLAHFAAVLACDNGAAILQYFRSASAVDGTIHSTTAQEAGVRGVHDGLNRELRDITLSSAEHHHFIRLTA